MMCFRDMTFCPFDGECVKGEGCNRALTEYVLADAKAWWGEDGAPVAVFSGEPACFEQLKEGGRED